MKKHVSITGHLGGLVVGGVVAAILAYAPRKNRTALQAAGCAVVFVKLRKLEQQPPTANQQPPTDDPYLSRVRDLVSGGKQ